MSWPQQQAVGSSRLWVHSQLTYNPCVHYVYIVRCGDGTLYTGYARDPKARETAHNAGRGARYTSGRRPVVLVYVERFRSKGKALRREHEIKNYTRVQKHALCISPEAVRFDRGQHG